MRIMALDVGERRIGVAVCDPLGITAQAHSVLTRRGLDNDLEALSRLVEELEAERVVVGLPRNLNGSEGPSAQRSREFAELLTRKVRIPVELYDERLTTVEAENILLASDMSRRKRRQVIDKVAAALILEGYLHRRGREEYSPVAGVGDRDREDVN